MRIEVSARPNEATSFRPTREPAAHLGWAIADNPFGTAVSEPTISGIGLSTGTYSICDMDMPLPNSGTMPFVIGRTYKVRQDTNGCHFDSTQS